MLLKLELFLSGSFEIWFCILIRVVCCTVSCETKDSQIETPHFLQQSEEVVCYNGEWTLVLIN